MSKSLFAVLSRRLGRSLDAPSRRAFLKSTLAGTTGLLLSNLTGCETAQPAGTFKPAANAKRIVIIGAGFAGLAAGYELLAAGYDVTLLDPRSRVGGRVYSSSTFVKNKNAELGGELIGSNHPTWVAYADKFKLEFLDVTEDKSLSIPVIFDGKRLSDDEVKKLYDEMDEAYATLTEQAAAIDADYPWLSPKAAEIDATPLSLWWRALKVSDLTKKALWAQLSSDNAVELDKQSTLAMLTAIKAGGGKPYWDESEVYRCKGGNQQLAFKLAEAIGPARIKLNVAAKAVTQTDTGVIVIGTDGTTYEADEAILAAPPSTWHKIVFEPAIPPALQTQMGTALKYLSATKTRFWKDNGLAPDSLSDSAVSQTWEGSDNQPGEDSAELVAFSGGRAAQIVRGQGQIDAFYRLILEARYPGYTDNVTGRMFMDWPSDPWTLAGYSFAAPGQVTRLGPTLRQGLGRLHFAGEHTSFKFGGYMEGGLSSGAELAKRIALRDGVLKA